MRPIRLAFPLWVISGAAGGALVALSFLLRPGSRALPLAIGGALLLVWLVSGIRGRSLGVRARSDRLRRIARARTEDPPVPDPEALRARRDAHRIRSRGIRRGVNWLARFPWRRIHPAPPEDR